MASRFVVADNNVIEELKTSSENSNTRKSTINIGELILPSIIINTEVIAPSRLKLRFNFTCVL